MASSLRRFVGRVAVVALAVAVPVVMTPVAASADTPSDLFFSEYVEGSSNNKALEIFNGTGSPVDLAAAGYSVQGFFNGSASASLTVNLTGTVASGDVFVLAQATANAAILAVADQTSSAAWYNGDDAVVLRKGTTVLDVIGQVGTDPGTEWGSGLTSTADNTLRRKASVTAGDTNAADAFDPATGWEGFAVDTVEGLGAHPAIPDAAPAVTAVTPDAGAVAPVTSNLTVTFSEPVTAPASAFALTCGTSSVAFDLSGGPTTYTLDPAVDLPAGVSCTAGVVGSEVSDVDSNDPPDSPADRTWTFRTESGVDQCTLPAVTVGSVQGSGTTSPVVGQTTTVHGVVVGDYEGAAGLRGFYLQDTAADADGDPATSDGIFVFNGGNQDVVHVGDLVTVSGTVGENFEQTQVSSSIDRIAVCGTGTVGTTDVTLPKESATSYEKYEGMLVRLPQTLSVTEHFQLGRFGEVLVSSGGRLHQPTNVVEPGAAANALQAENDLNQLLIDDGSNAQNPDPILFARGGQPLSASNTLRGGDTATDTVGVMTYTFGGNATASPNAYRVRPVNALGGVIDFSAANPRPAHPEDVGGDVRVVGMNLLNFFNTFGTTACHLGTQGATTECRGADTAAEFERQWPKTVAAILAMDPDVVGVNEIENDGYGPDSAIAFLVDKLNAATAPGTWAYVDADAETGQVDALGTDAIKVGQIYKPAAVTRVGHTAVLNSTEFVNGGDNAPRSRPSLAQAYRVNATGGVFIADINHLKSKGSACSVPDAGDGQGNCNAARTVAAQALATWLASDPTGTGDHDVLLVGDYNSYAKEDPIRTLEAAGFTNLIADRIGADAYSYVFDGQWGYLDHALGSQSIRSQVTGVSEYHINSDEPSVLDYNTNFKTPDQQSTLYAPDQYRVSDHDPVVVGLSPNSPATVRAAFADDSLSCARTARLTVDVADRDAGDTHAVRVDWGDGSAPTTVDPATSPLSLNHRYAKAGRYTATVTVTDGHGHVTTTTAAVSVEYVSTGLVPRLGSSTSPLVVKRGSVLPVAVGYLDCSGQIPRDADPVITVELGGSTVLEQPMSQVGPVWLHLLRTASLPASTGTFTVTVTVPSTGQTDTGTFRLRR